VFLCAVDGIKRESKSNPEKIQKSNIRHQCMKTKTVCCIYRESGTLMNDSGSCFKIGQGVNRFAPFPGDSVTISFLFSHTDNNCLH